eukprot:TRINITY_DN4327_c0_g1_i2.p1 TRINITY_DN4327_c0_g1~~TRINITY_DN4327_c0_g1_i2.p1  ORF type:complete len:141 (-),score=36.11 TRINITY_DN4327_c0_g1_i2:382-768(-)
MAKRGTKRQKTNKLEGEEEERCSTEQIELKETANVVECEEKNVRPVVFADDQERQQWALKLRQKFTPKEMLKEDGTINHDWFKPKAIRIKVRKWGGKERELLVKGIEKHGIGNWTAIRQESLPDWVSF